MSVEMEIDSHDNTFMAATTNDMNEVSPETLNKSKKRTEYKARRKAREQQAESMPGGLSRHEQAIQKLEALKKEQLQEEKDEPMQRVQDFTVYNDNGLPIIGAGENRQIQVVQMLLRTTQQWQWYKKMVDIQFKFSEQCRNDGIEWCITTMNSLMNRDFQAPAFPKRAIDPLTHKVKANWVKHEGNGWAHVFELTAELRKALAEDKVVLPHFYIFEYCLQPIHTAPPIELKQFEAALSTLLKTTMSCVEPKILDAIVQFNGSRYSDLYEAMLIRFAYITELKDRKDPKFDAKQDYLVMLVTLLVFGGRMF
jgi:hypothetical protein